MGQPGPWRTLLLGWSNNWGGTRGRYTFVFVKIGKTTAMGPKRWARRRDTACGLAGCRPVAPYSTRQKYSAPWSPSLVFLQYLLNKCKYQRQTFCTLSRINITRYVKIWKSRVIGRPQMTPEWHNVPSISTPPRTQFLSYNQLTYTRGVQKVRGPTTKEHR